MMQVLCKMEQMQHTLGQNRTMAEILDTDESSASTWRRLLGDLKDGSDGTLQFEATSDGTLSLIPLQAASTSQQT